MANHCFRMTLAVLLIGTTNAWSAPRFRTSGMQPSSRHWAVLIGIDQYSHLGNLRYSRRDAEALRDVLIKSGFRKSQIILITDGQEGEAVMPTRRRIEDSIRDVLEHLVSPGDTVVISFSGHGLNIHGKSFLCPADADPTNELDLISLESLYRSISRSKASQKVVLIDACRNEQHKDKTESLDLLTGLRGIQSADSRLPEGFVLMASCLSGQISIEDDQLQHGVFMNYVVEGLSGAADTQLAGNRDGRISPYELYQYAQAKTRERSFGVHGWDQRPWWKGEISGDLALVSLPATQRLLALRAGNQRVSPVSAEQEQAQFEYANAVIAMQEGNIPRVIERASKAIQLVSSHKAARRIRGTAYRLQGEFAKAVMDYAAIGEKLSVTVLSDTQLLATDESGNQQIIANLSNGDVVDLGTVEYTGAENEYAWFRVDGIRRQGSEQTTPPSSVAYLDADVLKATQASSEQTIQAAQDFQRRNNIPVSEFASVYTGRSNGMRASSDGERVIEAMDTYEAVAVPFGAPSVPYGGAIRSAIRIFGN